ncbi:hypothetical protein L411_00310 [Escherichia coli BWH 24]|nr:hypothetical protein L411_00310 [Escherichia coli BWH 24]
MTVVAALMAVFFIMQLVGQVPAALWVIFGEDRFHWDATTIGISLAAFGILHSLAQAMIHRPCSRPARRKAGTHARNDCRRHRLTSCLPSRHGMDGVPDHGPACFGWHRNAGAASNVVRQVDEERQGQLQGSLAALTSLTRSSDPPLFTAIYAASITTWNGGHGLQALPSTCSAAGAASRALERRRATSRSLIVETIGLCHAGQATSGKLYAP